jgi:hypothetical protein
LAAGFGLALALLSPAQAAATLRHEVGFAGDYTNQSYATTSCDSLQYPTEKDTLDVETEGKILWNLDFNLETPATVFGADNDLNVSTRSIRDALDLGFSHVLSRLFSLELANTAEVRYYHNAFPRLADTSYARSHLSNTSELTFHCSPSEELTASVADEVQLLHYPVTDSYNYDYIFNRMRVSLQQEFGILSAFNLDYYWVRRWPGIASDQRYWEHKVEADFDWYIEAGPHLEIENSIVRRRYPSAGRSYWEENPRLSFELFPATAWTISLDDEPCWTLYDSPGSVYSDLFENTARLTCEVQATSVFSFKVGLQSDNGYSLPGATSDDYREGSVIAGVDLMRVGRFWLSVEDRLGRRRYPQADSSFQSNYTFNEFNLMADWTVVKVGDGGLSLNGIVSISPEWHADSAANLATRIYTLELKYGL